MGLDYHGESSGGRNNRPQLQPIIPEPIPYNELAKLYCQLFLMNEESKKLIEGQNNQIAVLNQRHREDKSLVQTLQIKNENQKFLIRQNNDEISDWKDKCEKQRLATKMNADKIEEQKKEIKKVREEKEELELRYKKRTRKLKSQNLRCKKKMEKSKN